MIQQDKENKCIFADENDHKREGWRHIELQLNLSDGDPRFFLEAQYDANHNNNQDQNIGPDPGYIGISRFSFSFGRCSRNDVNNCFADIVEKPIVPPPPAE